MGRWSSKYRWYPSIGSDAAVASRKLGTKSMSMACRVMCRAALRAATTAWWQVCFGCYGEGGRSRGRPRSTPAKALAHVIQQATLLLRQAVESSLRDLVQHPVHLIIRRPA